MYRLIVSRIAFSFDENLTLRRTVQYFVQLSVILHHLYKMS